MLPTDFCISCLIVYLVLICAGKIHPDQLWCHRIHCWSQYWNLYPISKHLTEVDWHKHHRWDIFKGASQKGFLEAPIKNESKWCFHHRILQKFVAGVWGSASYIWSYSLTWSQLRVIGLTHQVDFSLTILCQTCLKNPELFVKPKMSAPSMFSTSCWLELESTSDVSRVKFYVTKDLDHSWFWQLNYVKDKISESDIILYVINC